MLRIALSTLGARKSGALGALVAVGLAVVLVVSCGILLESSLRKPIPVGRLHAAAVVVEGDPSVEQENGEAGIGVLLTERHRIGTGLAGRIRELPGVATVVGDRSVYAQLLDQRGAVLEDRDGVTSLGHGWTSAALTPYALTSGHVPRRPGDVVVDASLAAAGSIRAGARVRVLTASATRTFSVVGIARPARGLDLEEAGLFFRDDV